MKRFGEKLRTVRKQQGMTQKQLGDLLEQHFQEAINKTKQVEISKQKQKGAKK
ncbi:hypothetical protein QUF64_14975 [Anaerolineales bacterium HSG6]|nr:hypothetical protein [Anaerolineales bacterium HSG6]MDM8530149.1 hypothetical protein [Anaerolineales bacterium HSG25]